MKTLSYFSRHSLSAVSVVLACAAAACGATVVVDPIGTEGDPNSPPPTGMTTKPVPAPAPSTPAPKAPVGPYTGLVGTTDVSILYPLPLKGESTAFVRPSEAGIYGPLLRESSFNGMILGRRIDRVQLDPPSGYAQLALISLRIDPCSARRGAGCTSEVRAVFQAIYDKTAPSEDGDATLGAAATDGALHVMYDVPEAELVIMMKQLLTLKAAEGNLASQVLEPHPILAKQGLAGGFATGLRAVVLEHLGDDRVGRITSFDHNFEPDGDGWTFKVSDKAGAALTPQRIPHLGAASQQTVAGSSAVVGPMSTSNAVSFIGANTDQVDPLLKGDRPQAGSPQVSSLQPAFEAALRVQNPKLHNSETTDCGNCHLAEGARLLGESVYSLKSTGAFTHLRPLDYRTERASVSNLHAFGYLHRKVSITQRTANESVIVADAMELKVK